MATLMSLDTPDGVIEIHRNFADDGIPLLAAVWAHQVFGQPPPYTGPEIPVSLPYYSIADAIRMRDAASKLLPSWQIVIHEVHVARAITHDDATALFRRWGW